MRRALYRAAAALVLTAALAAPPALAEDYYDGLRAYEQGEHREAARIWRQAAEAGDPKARFRLGQLYERGEGVPRDYVRALQWYLLAQEQGNTDADVAAYFLRRNMTEQQQRAAQQRAEAARASAATPDPAQPPGDAQDRDGRQAAEVRPARPEQRNQAATSEGDVRPNDDGGRVEWWGQGRGRDPNSGSARSAAPADRKLYILVAGSEIRRAMDYGDVIRYDLWQFRRDGTVHGTYSASAGRRDAVDREDVDQGMWEVRGEMLCVTWDNWDEGRENCYRVSRLPGGRWRMTHVETGEPSGESEGHAERRSR